MTPDYKIKMKGFAPEHADCLECEGVQDDPDIRCFKFLHPRTGFIFLGLITLLGTLAYIINVLTYFTVSFGLIKNKKRWIVKIMQFNHPPTIKTNDDDYFRSPTLTDPDQDMWLPITILAPGLLLIVPFYIYVNFLIHGQRIYLQTAHFFLMII